MLQQAHQKQTPQKTKKAAGKGALRIEVDSKNKEAGCKQFF